MSCQNPSHKHFIVRGKISRVEFLQWTSTGYVRCERIGTDGEDVSIWFTRRGNKELYVRRVQGKNERYRRYPITFGYEEVSGRFHLVSNCPMLWDGDRIDFLPPEETPKCELPSEQTSEFQQERGRTTSGERSPRRATSARVGRRAR